MNYFNMFGVKMSAVQSYVDKKFDAFSKYFNKNIVNELATRQQVQSLQGQLDSMTAKYKKLVEYLGLEYKEEVVKGYSKVKKTKKK